MEPPNKSHVRKAILPFACGLWLLSVAALAIDTTELARYIEDARLAWRIPGLAVGIVKDGRVVLSRGFGLRHHSSGDPVDENTLFAVASNTKAFTAATLAILVDEGRLNWADRVRDHLPYFQLYSPCVSEAFTVEDLLCHRSGLATFSGDLLWYETSYGTVEIIRRARFLRPVFPFRAGYGYSNILYLAAGEVVAAVSGQPWTAFVRERIFKPLSMTRTRIGIQGLEGVDNVAQPHWVSPEGEVTTVPHTTSDRIASAAGIVSCVRDMTRWLQMLLDEGRYEDGAVLSGEAISALWTQHNALPVGQAHRELFPDTHFRGYGLGWGMEDYRGRKILGHSGALDGMISRVTLVPEEKLGLVILTNSINGLPRALSYRIVDTVLGTPSRDWSGVFLAKSREKDSRRRADKKAEASLQTDTKAKRPPLDEYTGEFLDRMYGEARVTRKGSGLVLHFVPTPRFVSDLSWSHHDVFHLKLRHDFSFIPAGTGRVQFLRDMDGRVAGMRIDIPNDDFLFHELDFKKMASHGTEHP